MTSRYAAGRDAPAAPSATPQEDGLLEPSADLVMVVDKNNTAHVLHPADDRPVFRPTLCGGQRNDLAALSDLLDTLSAPWSLLTDPQYRAWPPWPCQTCLGTLLRQERP